MLNPQPTDYCRVDHTEMDMLVVVVDTEEDFDWSRGRSRSHTAVRALRWIGRLQDIFDEYSITPIYVIDYPVASQADGYQPLQEIHSAGRCLIGAHLHPWVNPPYEEQLNPYNSFPGNLPRHLEAEKLRILDDCIGEQFGSRPIIYKAGRYGFGPHTADILEEQGYEVDLSVCPHMDYSAEGGPDFTRYSAWPYWFGKHRRLLELPLTLGFAGLLRRWGTTLHGLASRPTLAAMHAPGILARLSLVKMIWLSPEGYLSVEHIKLVRALHHEGLRIFSFAFHSSSLEPGYTPYVRSWHDLEALLCRCRKFFDFFIGELGGCPTTPLQLREQLMASMGPSDWKDP
jgi:hypothetical protein